MKQIFDLVAGLVLLALLAVFMVILGLIVRWTSPGPALFVQTRLGRHKQPFALYKFRTMHVDTPDLATHEVNRSAVTPLGRFLRGSKLDELPQLLNVVKGEMSFVGPRPCLPRQAHLVALRDEGKVWDLKPGITGLSQVSGIAMDEPEKLVAKDVEYRKSQSFWVDMRLLIQTVLGAGQGDKIK